MGRGEARGKCLYFPLNFPVYLKTFVLFKGVFIPKTNKQTKKNLGLNIPNLCMEQDPWPDTLCSPLGQGPVPLYL